MPISNADPIPAIKELNSTIKEANKKANFLGWAMFSLAVVQIIVTGLDIYMN